MPSVIRGSDSFDSGEVIGQNQTWQDVTASRATGVNYTNTTGKPIMLSVRVTTISAGDYMSLFIDNDEVVDDLMGSTVVGNFQINQTVIVPNLSTYRCATTGNLVAWYELR